MDSINSNLVIRALKKYCKHSAPDLCVILSAMKRMNHTNAPESHSRGSSRRKIAICVEIRGLVQRACNELCVRYGHPIRTVDIALKKDRYLCVALVAQRSRRSFPKPDEKTRSSPR